MFYAVNFAVILYIFSEPVCCNEMSDAINKGDETKIQDLLRRNEGIAFQPCDISQCKCTPLLHATRIGEKNVAEMFLKMGADVKIPSCRIHFSPLHYAVTHGMIDVAAFMLEKGAELKDGDLHQAVRNKDSAMVKLLCDNEADVNAENCFGITPLVEALLHARNVGCDNADVIRILLDKGADVNARSGRMNTALHYAARLNCERNGDIMELLLSVKNVEIERKNGEEYTALHIAADYDNVEGFRILLAAGADVHARGPFGQTILHHHASRRNPAMVALAKAYGFRMEAKDVYGNTPLLHAATFQDKKAVGVLSEHGADVNSPNDGSGTALYYAAARSTHTTPDFLEFLSFHGAHLGMPPGKTGECFGWKSFRHKGKVIRNALLEAGEMNVDAENSREILAKDWSVKIADLATISNKKERFPNMTEFVLAAVKSYVKKPRLPLDFRQTVQMYWDNKLFALYKILKSLYHDDGPIEGLESRMLDIFDGACHEITKRTYFQSLPLDLFSDVLTVNEYYDWKLKKLAFDISLATYTANVGLDEGHDLARTFIFSESFTPVI